MITSLERISGLGVFDNYIKPVGTEPFSEVNIIYGARHINEKMGKNVGINDIGGLCK